MPKEKEHEEPTVARMEHQGDLLRPSTMADLRIPSVERMGYVEGLLRELDSQTKHHIHLVQQLAELQARTDISERNLRLTRDHLLSTLESTKEDVPLNWREATSRVRFVGARLGDAAMEVLKSRPTPLSVGELEAALNEGQFRFRTGHPKREIHAALLRQRAAQRNPEDDTWEYVPGKEVSKRAG